MIIKMGANLKDDLHSHWKQLWHFNHAADHFTILEFQNMSIDLIEFANWRFLELLICEKFGRTSAEAFKAFRNERLENK